MGGAVRSVGFAGVRTQRAKYSARRRTFRLLAPFGLLMLLLVGVIVVSRDASMLLDPATVGVGLLLVLGMGVFVWEAGLAMVAAEAGTDGLSVIVERSDAPRTFTWEQLDGAWTDDPESLAVWVKGRRWPFYLHREDLDGAWKHDPAGPAVLAKDPRWPFLVRQENRAPAADLAEIHAEVRAHTFERHPQGCITRFALGRTPEDV